MIIDSKFNGEEKTRIEILRYNKIAGYYKENPERKSPNEGYLVEIVDSLLDIQDKGMMPKKLEQLTSELIEFFSESSH